MNFFLKICQLLFMNEDIKIRNKCEPQVVLSFIFLKL